MTAPVHPRTLIRAAFRARLIAAPHAEAAGTGSRVFINRTIPLTVALLPAVVIYTPTDNASPEEPLSAEATRRECVVALEAVAAGPQADEIADRVAAAIELAFPEDDTLGLLVERVSYRNSTTEHSSEGQQNLAVVRLEYVVTYWVVREQAPPPAAPSAVLLKIFSPFGIPEEPNYELILGSLPDPDPEPEGEPDA